LEGERLLVVLNFTSGTPVFSLPEDLPAGNAELLISNYAVDAAEDITSLTLRPFEARVYRLR
jgi:oligo-1,6-glucosidase